MSETSGPTKKEIFLHYPNIKIAQAIVYYHNFGSGYDDSPSRLCYFGQQDKPTDEGLFKFSYEIVYDKKRFLRRSERIILGRVHFHVEKARIGINIVHQVDIQAYGLPVQFQNLKTEFEGYFGKGRINLSFIWNEPRDW